MFIYLFILNIYIYIIREYLTKGLKIFKSPITSHGKHIQIPPATKSICHINLLFTFPLCMYRASCTFCKPDQQMSNIKVLIKFHVPWVVLHVSMHLTSPSGSLSENDKTHRNKQEYLRHIKFCIYIYIYMLRICWSG